MGSHARAMSRALARNFPAAAVQQAFFTAFRRYFAVASTPKIATLEGSYFNFVTRRVGRNSRNKTSLKVRWVDWLTKQRASGQRDEPSNLIGDRLAVTVQE